MLHNAEYMLVTASYASAIAVFVTPISIYFTLRFKKEKPGFSIVFPIGLMAFLLTIATFIIFLIGHVIYVKIWSYSACGTSTCLEKNDSFVYYQMMAGLAFSAGAGFAGLLSLATSAITLLTVAMRKSV